MAEIVWRDVLEADSPQYKCGKRSGVYPFVKNTGNLYFDLFWDAYPKRVKKVLALKEWHRLKDFTISDILAGIERWKQSAQWQDIQFVPDPERFIKYRRWEDEVPQNAGTKNDKRISRTIEAAKRVVEFGRAMGDTPRLALPGGDVRTGDKDLLRIPRK